jgi:membrane complex biogenesis BtpA family protein
MLFNIVPEAASYLASRDLASIARSTIFNCLPDGLCISGLTAGAPTDTSMLKTVKDIATDTAVVVNTGVNADNVREQLSIADAAIVGTFFKRDGKFENSVDPERVRLLMDQVQVLRDELPA